MPIPEKKSSYNVSLNGQRGGNKWSGEVYYQEPLTENKVDYRHSLLVASIQIMYGRTARKEGRGSKEKSEQSALFEFWQLQYYPTS